jgi:LAO/AO transport system kinase
VAIIAVDPSSARTGGAILGDRIRMQSHYKDAGIFIRSMATRGAHGGLAAATADMVRLFRLAGWDIVLVETVGVGQSEVDIAGVADVTLVVLVPGMGDEVQVIKSGLLEIADIFVINKADHAGVAQLQNDLHTNFKAPIVQTIATAGGGIDDLVAAVSQAFLPAQPPANQENDA